MGWFGLGKNGKGKEEKTPPKTGVIPVAAVKPAAAAPAGPSAPLPLASASSDLPIEDIQKLIAATVETTMSKAHALTVKAEESDSKKEHVDITLPAQALADDILHKKFGFAPQEYKRFSLAPAASDWLVPQASYETLVETLKTKDKIKKTADRKRFLPDRLAEIVSDGNEALENFTIILTGDKDYPYLFSGLPKNQSREPFFGAKPDDVRAPYPIVLHKSILTIPMERIEQMHDLKAASAGPDESVAGLPPVSTSAPTSTNFDIPLEPPATPAPTPAPSTISTAAPTPVPAPPARPSIIHTKSGIAKSAAGNGHKLPKDQALDKLNAALDGTVSVTHQNALVAGAGHFTIGFGEGMKETLFEKLGKLGFSNIEAKPSGKQQWVVPKATLESIAPESKKQLGASGIAGWIKVGGHEYGLGFKLKDKHIKITSTPNGNAFIVDNVPEGKTPDMVFSTIDGILVQPKLTITLSEQDAYKALGIEIPEIKR